MNAKLNIGIVCFPGIGGSGIVATELGMLLAREGHRVHFISYDQPFRLNGEIENVSWHEVTTSQYSLFKHEDYTLPLAVRISEVSRAHALDVIHVHYAVPHAVAALLACDMMGAHRPAVVTTLHGTDTTLIGRDPAFQPIIQHALRHSDALTAVSNHLAEDTRHVFGEDLDIDTVYNFYEAKPPTASRKAVRQRLGIAEDSPMLIHVSNLRPVKRVDLLIDTFARVRSQMASSLLIVGGGDIRECKEKARLRGVASDVHFCQDVSDVDTLFSAADVGLYTSEKESFGLSVLEGMCHGLPTVAFSVGGLPEVVNESCGFLVNFADTEALAKAALTLLSDKALLGAASIAARKRAQTYFRPSYAAQSYSKVYLKALAKRQAVSQCD